MLLPGYPEMNVLSPTVSVSSTALNEGDTLTVTCRNLWPNTQYFFSLDGTTSVEDFTGGNDGNFTTDSAGVGVVSITLVNDLSLTESPETEGAEQFQFVLRAGSTSGQELTRSQLVTVADTSDISPDRSNSVIVVKEIGDNDSGGAASLNMSGISDGDDIYILAVDGPGNLESTYGFTKKYSLGSYGGGLYHKVAASEPSSYDLTSCDQATGIVLRNGTYRHLNNTVSSSYTLSGTTLHDNSIVIALACNRDWNGSTYTLGNSWTTDQYVRDTDINTDGNGSRKWARARQVIQGSTISISCGGGGYGGAVLFEHYN